MNDSVEEYSTPKIGGEGDGIRNTTGKKRPQVPSSRKFCVRSQRDESLKLKLENAISDMHGKPKVHDCLKRSQTVAEITPTKTKVKINKIKSSTNNNSDDAAKIILYATPRSPDTDQAGKPERCPRDKAVCMVYQRLLLCIWRRNKARLANLSDLCERQQNQLNQLELQVDFLRKLRASECTKRDEALNEYQRLKRKLDLLELENAQLDEKCRKTQDKLANSQEYLNLTQCDLKKCTEQLGKIQKQLGKKKEQKMDLIIKLSKQEQELYSQKAVITRLEEALKTSQMNLHNSESNYKAKDDEFNEVLQQLQNEVEMNSTLKEEMCALQKNKTALENQSKIMEDQLEQLISSCEQLKQDNVYIKNNLAEVSIELCEEKEKTWYKHTKDLASFSWSTLQKIADVVLPLYSNSSL